MATWYVYPGATGANNGTSATDAWTHVSSALTSGSVGQGDIVYCRGSETISSTISSSVWWGTNGPPYQPVQFIGVNSSWVVDGTKYTLTVGASDIYVIYPNSGANGVVLKYFAFVNPSHYTTVIGVNGSQASWWQLINCSFSYFWIGAQLQYSIVTSCYFSSCTYGTVCINHNKLLDCRFDNCSTAGAKASASDVYIGCVFSNNSHGIEYITNSGDVQVEQSTFYNNTIGIYINTYNMWIKDSVFVSNTSYDISLAGSGAQNVSYESGCCYYPSKSIYLYSNTALVLLGTSTVLGSDPLQNAAGGNFMPSASAGGMANALSLGDGTNYTYVDAGLQRHDTNTPSTGMSVTVVFI